MADLIIYGSPNSSYVRTTRLACEEKGVSYEEGMVGENRFEDLKAPEHLARHPWGRIPVMQHGDFMLYESTAICRYVDEAFQGPPLQPAGLKERARMNQWISAVKDYMVPDMIGGFIVQYAFPSGPDGKPDLRRIAESKPKIRRHCEILDQALANDPYLAGAQPTIAELMLVPILHYVGNTPGGLELFDGLDNLGRWWSAFSARPSFTATIPPMLAEGEKAA